jgi:hypothetical protein
MHKTGTTSLACALSILGFDTAHWTTPRWARSVWRDIKRRGRSLKLEQHYAATDLPITVLYKELDKAYPNSKFILTVRDEVDWLASVRDHWSAHNPWRSSWDNDCFTHQMHGEVYGRKDFDASTFLARYRRHNAEVQEYFGDRLLVMQTGWEKLCEFLELPIPDVEYPRLNAKLSGRHPQS